MYDKTAPVAFLTKLSGVRPLVQTEDLMEDPQQVVFLEQKCKGPTILASTQNLKCERCLV